MIFMIIFNFGVVKKWVKDVLQTPYLIGMFGGTDVVNPFDPADPDAQYCSQYFTLYKEGTTTALASASVYGWYDWDGDGTVDLGAFEGISADGVLVNGEIESLTSAATTGLVTTAVEYPVGELVSYQIHLADYEKNTFTRARNSLPIAHDGSALSVTAIYLRLSAAGQGYASETNTGNLVTATEYAGGTYGFTPTIEIKCISNTTDSGFSEVEYYDWSNGKHYTGQFVGITMTTQDFIDGNPSGFDFVFPGASNYFMIMWVGSHFDDDGVSGDQTFALGELNMVMTADCNMTVGFYSGILWDSAMLGICCYCCNLKCRF